MIYPPEDVLLELGRVTWAAMALEGDVLRVARRVDPKLQGEWRVGECVKNARNAMAEWPASTERDEISAWLADSKTALDEERNELFHGEQLTLINFAAGTYTPMVGVMPLEATKNRAARPYRERPLTAAHWQEAHARIVQQHELWTHILLLLEVVPR
ncbi:hypothetical protein [Amycolatopsis sp. NPDC051372]|uniref:hypothetical protein n=1 Tax=Amycolatopsis sp. NPDC051372 TaxID=3155669 RepID=UPI003428D745